MSTSPESDAGPRGETLLSPVVEPLSRRTPVRAAPDGREFEDEAIEGQIETRASCSVVLGMISRSELTPTARRAEERPARMPRLPGGGRSWIPISALDPDANE